MSSSVMQAAIEAKEPEAWVLPRVPMGKRIIPNDLVRSSLFTVVNHKEQRHYFKAHPIFTFGNTHIVYTGEELRQDDADVWMQLVMMASKQKNYHLTFAPYTFMREIEWPGRSQYRDKLKETLTRQSATNVEIVNNRIHESLNVSLIRKFTCYDDNGNKLKHWQVWLEPEMVALFENMSFSKVLWHQRQRLNPLAKWLHAYYSSHAEPFALKVATLHAACGSRTKAMKHFKSALRRALIELVQVGFLEDFFIDARNLVHVVRLSEKKGEEGTYE